LLVPFEKSYLFPKPKEQVRVSLGEEQL